jgi:hypothetical protein
MEQSVAKIRRGWTLGRNAARGTEALRRRWRMMKHRSERRLLPLVAAWSLLLSGCAYLHKPESTEFDATADGFAFRAIADAAYPEDTPNGEAWRMRWLEQRLLETGTCPHGYTITSRETERLSTGSLGSIYDVYYEGQCIGDAHADKGSI